MDVSAFTPPANEPHLVYTYFSIYLELPHLVFFLGITSYNNRLFFVLSLPVCFGHCDVLVLFLWGVVCWMSPCPRLFGFGLEDVLRMPDACD